MGIIEELLKDKYKLRIPSTVYYDLLADVQEVEEEQEPTTKNNLGVDCIDRNYATRLLADIYHNSISDSSLKIYQIINWLNQLPSVTPQEPKIGYWTYIRNSEVNGLKIVECSECGKRTYGSVNYCPNCGALMVEPQESEDKE